MISRAFLTWLLLAVLAVLNGVVRNAVITPRLGAYAGHVLSTLVLCVVIIAVVWLAIQWIAPGTSRRAWAVGLGWVLLTIAFEFGAGHYLFGNSWQKLLADYNVFQGRVWLLVLLTTLLAPPLVVHFRSAVSDGPS